MARISLLREHSQNLEEVHVAFFIDASVFFGGPSDEGGFWNCLPMMWYRLRCLSLTSDYLRGVPVLASSADANKLFEAAADGASRMPQLEIMELWHAGERSATLFRYKRRSAMDGVPLVELKSSWGLRLQPEVELAWRAVARSHNDQDALVVRYDTVSAARRRNVAMFMDELESKPKLLTETTYLQMRMEAEDNR